MMKNVLAVVMPFLCLAGSAQSEPVLNKVDSAVRAEMKVQQIPGVAVAIVQNGKTILVRGYGEANLEHHVPVKAETIFQSGSVGKQFTSAAVMLLVEDGKLALDDPITKFFPDAPASWTTIKVKHLLTHTSGIPDYSDTDVDNRKDYTDAELASIAYGLPLEFSPGSHWNYSNTGYVLLGIIIQKVSGTFYGDVLAERIFKPLGMKTARVISDADIVYNRASAYQLVNGKIKNQDWVSPALNATADGSLYLSLQDYLKWNQAVRAKKVLKNTSWDAILSPVVLNSGNAYPYGFGWEVEKIKGQNHYFHDGSWQGFRTYISLWFGEDLTVVVLANSAQADPVVIGEKIAGIVQPELAKPELTGIPDTAPVISERLIKLLAVTQQGNLSPAYFSFARYGFIPRVTSSYKTMLDGLEAPDHIQFLECKVLGDDKVYSYAVAYGLKKFRVNLGISPDDKISIFELNQK